MITVKHGNLFGTDAKYICHQVNCQGVMGSGVAKQVRERYPEVYDAYRDRCFSGGYLVTWNIGTTQFVECHDGKTIVNMFAQIDYGKTSRHTDYFAFAECLTDIINNIPVGETVAMPYKIGCGLGGGDWDVIYSMIESALGGSYNVELWQL